MINPNQIQKKTTLCDIFLLNLKVMVLLTTKTLSFTQAHIFSEFGGHTKGLQNTFSDTLKSTFDVIIWEY